MNWVLKAFFQKCLSCIPVGENINYICQRYILKNLPANSEVFNNKINRALQHFEAFREYGSVDIAKAKLYEFGTGWDMIIPLTLYLYGAKDQTAIDINPIIRFNLINNTIARLKTRCDYLQESTRIRIRADLLNTEITQNNDLNDQFGIKYLAPVDAGNTNFDTESFDFISSTVTLEHIPEYAIPGILNECKRILKPQGIISLAIDMRDHYSYIDRNISCYNYLKYEDSRWKRYNSSLHFQNRLRYSDYIQLFRSAGLEMLAEFRAEASASDMAILKNLQLADQYNKYSLNDLSIKGLRVILRKAGSEHEYKR